MSTNSLSLPNEKMLDPFDRLPEEQAALTRLMSLFQILPPPPDPLGLMPNYGQLRDEFVCAMSGTDSERIEETFLNLYCRVHGHEAPYTTQERKQVNERGGYWCHAGGLSPILKAGQFVHRDTVFADYGAGNGLQGLLVQKLWPHRQTVQIEISSKMVEAGKELQNWLEIPIDRVEWVVGDVADTSPNAMDFIYLYRPLRPVGPGAAFYKYFARELARSDRFPITIFSIADCLKEFLDDSFEIFYNDGHLTCFKKKLSM